MLTIDEKEKREQEIINKCTELNHEIDKNFKYINVKSKFDIKCSVHNKIYTASYYSFIIRGSNCKSCSLAIHHNKRLIKNSSLQIIKNRCIETNTILLSEEKNYKVDDYISLKCVKHDYVFDIKYDKFKYQSCKYCGHELRSNSKTIKEIDGKDIVTFIKDKCEKNNYTWINESTYSHNKLSDILLFKCNNDNYQWTTTLKCFTTSNCYRCEMDRTVKLEQSYVISEINTFCNEQDYTWVNVDSFKYIILHYNNIIIKCNKCSNELTTNFLSIKEKRPCYKCLDNLNHSIAENNIISKCEKDNYKFVEDNFIYKSCNDKLKFICDKGHHFTMSYYYFVHRDQHCKLCHYKKFTENNFLTPDEYNKIIYDYCLTHNCEFENRNSFVYITASDKNIRIKCLNCNRSRLTCLCYLKYSKGCKYCSNGKSKLEIIWLDSLGILEENRQYHLNVPTIYNAETCKNIKSRGYYFDGYDPLTNTLYEYNGNYWHGNPRVFSPHEINFACNKGIGMTFDQLNSKTSIKRCFALSLGYTVIEMWEDSRSFRYTRDSIDILS